MVLGTIRNRVGSPMSFQTVYKSVGTLPFCFRFTSLIMIIVFIFVYLILYVLLHFQCQDNVNAQTRKFHAQPSFILLISNPICNKTVNPRSYHMDNASIYVFYI